MPNPAFIQGNTTTGGAGQSSATCAFPSNVTAGSLLYCTVRFSSSGGTVTNITCTDNNGNTWTPTTATFNPGDFFRSFYVVPANAGATTVTITIVGGATGFIRLAISESGPGITGIDVVGQWSYTVNAGTLLYGLGINTSHSNVYAILGGGQNTTSATPTAGGGFTVEVVNASGDAMIADMFSALPLASSGAGNITWSVSTKNALLQVTFLTSTSAAANLWVRKGQVIPGTFADFTFTVGAGTEGPNVIVEGSPKILTQYNTVFKMWFQGGANTNYAESVDGVNWTRYPSNLLTNALYFPRVTKVGSTYYMAGVRAGSFPWTNIDIYSSTDGLTWTIYQSGTITVSGGGFTSFTHGLLWIEGGTWYLIWDEYNVGAQTYHVGVATSANQGSTWTNHGVIISTNNPSGPFLQKVGSTYYLWAESWLFAGPQLTGASDIYRWHASSITGPWTMDGSSMQRIESDEGPDSIGTNGEVSDVCLVQVGSQTFLYYVATTTQASQTVLNSYIKVAVAATTIAGVVASAEGTATDSIGTSGSVGGAIVQSNSFASASASGPNSPGLAFSSNNTAGNFLLLLARITDGVNINIGLTGVTDTAGNTWQFGFAFAHPGNVANNFDTFIAYFVPSCKAGANTVTINTTDLTALFWNFAIIEYSGLGASPTIIASNYAAGVQAVSGSSGLLGNLHARQGGIMAAIFGNPTTNSLTLTPGSGWTGRQTMNGNTIAMDSLASGAGIFQAPCGFSSAVPWEGAMVLLGTPIPVTPILPEGGGGGGFGPGGQGGTSPSSFGFRFGF